MEKIINKKIELTSNIRGIEKLNHELYSKDKEIAEFHFTMNKLTAEKVICLFHFKGTKRYKEVEAVIDDNSFTVKFDNSLIIASETVAGYIYFEKVEKSADVYAFSFNVKISEIDKATQAPVMEQKTKRVIDVKDIVTKDELEGLLPKNNAPTTTYDDSELRAELASKANQSDIAHILDDINVLKAKPDNDTIYNDKPLVGRVEALEDKPSVDTSNLVTRDELDSRGYLTQHQSLDGYAKKSEIPQPYNDSGVKQRLSAIEQKEPQKLSLSGNTVSLSGGGGSIVLLSAPANTGGQVNEYEIYGQGMPNGKVTAPVGTTYVDTAVTNGALKWIKRSRTDNQGWEVLTGDTGWRTLNTLSKLTVGSRTSFIKIRRVNNLVSYQFGGLEWGWFGIIRRNGKGFVGQSKNGARVIETGGIPIGFRSENSLIGNIFNDKGEIYGIWYLGGESDSSFMHMTFEKGIPADKDIGDIRVSAVSYITDDPWPTTLP